MERLFDEESEYYNISLSDTLFLESRFGACPFREAELSNIHGL